MTDPTTPEPPVAPATPILDHLVTAATTPTQIKHPWQATVRTFAATLIAALTALIAAGPILSDALGAYLPPAAMGWVAGTLAFCTAFSAALTRLMAVPAVNAFLARVGLGAAPKA